MPTASPDRSAGARHPRTLPGAALRRALLAIDDAETRCERRGFRVTDPAVRERIERIGASFLAGYHEALAAGTGDGLDVALDTLEAETRGFAYEGAAMALALLDALVPGRGRRLAAFASGAGASHRYMVYVGAGWAMARTRWRLAARLRRLDPLLGWLAVDGYGFHQGYFRWPGRRTPPRPPRPFAGYGERVFDQGLGRSLWFVQGADPDRIAAAIGDLARPRRADLWSGVGLAAAYAGGVTCDVLEGLRERSGRYWTHLAQGAAFAAKARERAGNPAAHTAMACRVLCGLEAGPAAAITDEALPRLPAGGEKPAYEVWRERIRARLAERRPA